MKYTEVDVYEMFTEEVITEGQALDKLKTFLDIIKKTVSKDKIKAAIHKTARTSPPVLFAALAYLAGPKGTVTAAMIIELSYFIQKYESNKSIKDELERWKKEITSKEPDKKKTDETD